MFSFSTSLNEDCYGSKWELFSFPSSSSEVCLFDQVNGKSRPLAGGSRGVTDCPLRARGWFDPVAVRDDTVLLSRVDRNELYTIRGSHNHRCRLLWGLIDQLISVDKTRLWNSWDQWEAFIKPCWKAAGQWEQRAEESDAGESIRMTLVKESQNEWWSVKSSVASSLPFRCFQISFACHYYSKSINYYSKPTNFAVDYIY